MLVVALLMAFLLDTVIPLRCYSSCSSSKALLLDVVGFVALPRHYWSYSSSTTLLFDVATPLASFLCCFSYSSSMQHLFLLEVTLSPPPRHPYSSYFRYIFAPLDVVVVVHSRCWSCSSYFKLVLPPPPPFMFLQVWEDQVFQIQLF